MHGEHCGFDSQWSGGFSAGVWHGLIDDLKIVLPGGLPKISAATSCLWPGHSSRREDHTFPSPGRSPDPLGRLLCDPRLFPSLLGLSLQGSAVSELTTPDEEFGSLFMTRA